jgi:hypothetical protein
MCPDALTMVCTGTNSPSGDDQRRHIDEMNRGRTNMWDRVWRVSDACTWVYPRSTCLYLDIPGFGYGLGHGLWLSLGERVVLEQASLRYVHNIHLMQNITLLIWCLIALVMSRCESWIPNWIDDIYHVKTKTKQQVHYLWIHQLHHPQNSHILWERKEEKMKN